MRVSRSKHDNVNMPKAEDEGKELTKEYVNSPLHRFKVKFLFFLFVNQKFSSISSQSVRFYRPLH